MKSFFGRATVVAVALLLPWLMVTEVRAGEAQLISINHSFISQGSCFSAHMSYEGAAFFHVNGLPVPCYTKDFDELYNGDAISVFAGTFSSAWLRVGNNNIYYGIMTLFGGDYCTLAEHRAYLVAPGVQLPLFHLPRVGKTLTVDTTITLSLAQIDPRLAEQFAILRVAIDGLIAECEAAVASLIRDSSAYAQRLTQLRELKSKLDELIQRGLSNISEAELDALLATYETALPAGVRAQLVDFLNDLKGNIAEVRADVARILDVHHDQLDDTLRSYNATADSTGGADLDLDNPSTYESSGNVDETATVEMPPEIAGEDGFDESNDPYAQYADAVLAQLGRSIESGQVTNRGTFLSTVEGWRNNQLLLEAALKSKSPVAAEELAAFLAAQTRVVAVVQQYLDDTGWFRDTAIAPQLRAWVDGLLSEEMRDRAVALKRVWNQWAGPLAPEQLLYMDMGMVLAELHRRAVINFDAAEREPIRVAVFSWVDGLLEASRTLAAVGTSLTPAGDFVDLCEALSGKEWCNPDGRDLSATERVAAGLGVAAGSRTVWMAVGGVVGSGAVVISRSLAVLYDRLAEVPRQVVHRMVAELGADVLERLCLELPSNQLLRLFEQLGGKALKNLAQLAGAEITALEQALGREGLARLAQELDGRQIQSLQQAVGDEALQSLARLFSGNEAKAFVDAYGARAARSLALDLERQQIEQLAATLGESTLKQLAEELAGAEIQKLATDLGGASLAKLAGAGLTGLEIRRLGKSLGGETLADLTRRLDVLTLLELEASLARADIEALGGEAIEKLFNNQLGFGVTELSAWVTELGAGEVKRLADVFDVSELARYGLNAFDAAEHGTVWAAVKATQPLYEGTVIPRSFELTTVHGKVWVHGNATEHFYEYAKSMRERGVAADLVNVGTQVQISSMQAAVASAIQGGIPYGQRIISSGWQLTFGSPRDEGLLPVLYHALPER